MMLRTTRALFLLLVLVTLGAASARADDSAVRARPPASPRPRPSAEHDAEISVGGADNPSVAPYATALRRHYYEVLERRPWRAFGYELAVPGAGFVYAGFPVQAVVSASLTLLGAGLAVGGAVAENDACLYAGLAGFTAARVYGVVGAPVSAMLLNAALRHQLGITTRF